jgi:hypothetical protein
MYKKLIAGIMFTLVATGGTYALVGERSVDVDRPYYTEETVVYREPAVVYQEPVTPVVPAPVDVDIDEDIDDLDKVKIIEPTVEEERFANRPIQIRVD